MIPVLLQHELIASLYKHRKTSTNLFDRAGMDHGDSQHLTSAAGKLGTLDLETVGLGFWLDGIACKWDRTETVEIVTMSLPRQSGEWKDLRIPICTMDKCWVMKHDTLDDILAIVQWSLRFVALGQTPDRRHDGSAFLRSGTSRKRGGARIGCRALLCQITGDWSMLKQCFRFPQWNETRGCCWLCDVLPGEI